MAVKQLRIAIKLKGLRASLAAIDATATELAARRSALDVRIETLRTAVDEAATDEDRAACETEAAAIESDEAALATDTAANEAEKTRLSDEIAGLEAELAALNEAPAPTPTPAPNADRGAEHNINERTVRTMKKTRNMFGQTPEQRSAYLKNPDVAGFYANLRTMLKEKRAVNGTELTIPTVTLSLLRDNMDRYSKLLKHVNLVPVKGKARKKILGIAPEAIWTEATGKLNELDFGFALVEVDGYKIGGFVPLDNSDIEDSDENLSMIVEDALGQSLGKGCDRAILYGTGSKMPEGFLVRLAQAAKPATWPDTAPAWADLRATHIVTMDPADYDTAQEFFAALIVNLSKARPNYSDGVIVWAMTRTTHWDLVSRALMFNAGGAIVSGMNNVMPVIGGDVEYLDGIMPDGDIAGGFMSLYLMAERAGATMAASEHVRFLEDQTVFKATARYDGKAVFGEAFVVVNINNVAPTVASVFPPDIANPPVGP